MKKIPGHEMYSATEDGQIWSHHSNKFLKQSPKNQYGHLAVWVDGETIHTHTLMLETYIGPRPKGMVGCHLDGNRINNKKSNLAYATTKENMRHKQIHGTWQRGSNGSNSVLKESDVKHIRHEYLCVGVSQRKIAEGYGIKQCTVSAIIHRRIWGHLA